MSRSAEAVLGVVIPALNEAERLPLLLGDLERLSVPHRIVVADGGSEDGTPDVARRAGAEVVRAPPGRALQLNAGADRLDTPWILFLHADSRLTEEAVRTLSGWLHSASPHRSAHFRFRLDGSHWSWRLIELGQAVRERLFGLAYGDQGAVVSRATFDAVGGFPAVPLLEDVEFLARVRRHGPLDRLPAPLLTSPRRYVREGGLRVSLRNGLIIALHSMGVPPSRLTRWRPSSPREADRAVDRTLIVFAKAPTPGRVKTRLAEAVGVEEATRLYRFLGRRVLEQVRRGPYRTVVYFDPPGAEPEVREWLGDEGVAFRPQAEGDLGTRMSRAFRECFEDSERVCIVGTDAPEVDRSRVEEAFEALDRSDVVLGPALDGGYYLLALTDPRPELFRDVPWSTPEVLATTEQRARVAGLRCHLLPALADVDTVEDLPFGTAGTR